MTRFVQNNTVSFTVHLKKKNSKRCSFDWHYTSSSSPGRATGRGRRSLFPCNISLSPRNPKINKTHTHDQLANEKTEGTSPTGSWIIYMDDINISRAHNIHLTGKKER
jgi:hypothetical protein